MYRIVFVQYILFFILNCVLVALCSNFKMSNGTGLEQRVINKVCLLIPMEGPCRGGIKMFYFSPDLMKCDVFKWGGCQGNGNRFDTEEECEESCLASFKPNEKIRPKYCDLSFDYGFCFGSVKRWYYDRLWKTCKENLYSGCGGNKNNFYTRADCEKTCQYARRRLNTLN